MTSTEKVVRRYKVAAMDPAKMEALLQKIRKGATASLNWSQLGEVFQVLVPGWKLEKVVDFINLHGTDDNKDRATSFWDDKAAVEKKFEELKKDLVPSLPSTAKAGKLYVTELSEIEPGHGDGFQFRFKAYLGNEAWRIVTPEGKERIELPAKYDVSGGRIQPDKYTPMKAGKISLYRVIPWLLKETSFVADVNAKLGMEAHEVVVRTRDGTGTCPVCFQNVKITNGRDIVLHGYRRPGTGVTHGSCFGYKYTAFELSSKGCEEYLKKELEVDVIMLEKALKNFRSGNIKELTTSLYGKVLTPEDPDWDRVLKSKIAKAEDDLDTTKAMVEAFKKLIQKWKERPLPKEGERRIDWFSEGQK